MNNIKIINNLGTIFFVTPQFFIDYPRWKNEDPTFFYTENKRYLHNLDGPAIIDVQYDENEYYFIQGIEYKKEQWEKIANNIKFKQKFNEVLNG